MLGVVIELGELTGIATPSINTIYALVSLLDRNVQEQGVKIAAFPA